MFDFGHKVSLSSTQVPMDELKQAAKLVSEALFIRFKYMVLSMQSYCPVLADSLAAIHEDYSVDKFLAARNLDKPSPPIRKGIESNTLYYHHCEFSHLNRIQNCPIFSSTSSPS